MYHRFIYPNVLSLMLCAISTGFLFVLGANVAQANDIDDPQAFIDANLQHILQHEVGHALIELLELPVLAQEEDAADLYATMDVLDSFDDAEAQSILTYAVIANLALAAQTGTPETADYYDEHDLDIQRAYRIVCLGFGTDEDVFQTLADRFEMPEDRRDSCIDDAYRSWESWEKVLSPHRREEDAQPSAQNVSVDYIKNDEFSDVRDYFMEISLLEETAHYLDENFKLPQLLLKADYCGEANAFFDPEERSVTLCYELYDMLSDMTE